MLRILFALLFTASSVFADQQITAYAALKTVSRQVSPVALNRVISVTGVDGDPQPTRWNILVVDKHAAEGVREIQVANGRVIAQGPPTTNVVGSTSEATIPTSKLNLDSNGAFAVANHTADTSHLNFAFLTYTLRTNERGQPVWIVTLQDEGRRSLGTIHINANRGNITRVEGLYRGTNMATVEQDPGNRVVQRNVRPPRDVEQTAPEGEYVDQTGEGEVTDEGDEDENVVKKELKRLFRHTKDESQRVFHRVRSSFDDFMHR
ncbi:MAG: hypothetical protein ACJ8KX_11590 [Chthoniobacterales bacterium]